MTRSSLYYLSLLTLLFAFGCAPEDDDGIGEPLDLPTITISDASIVEGNGGTTLLTLTAKLEGLNLTNVVVDYNTKNGTATGGEDYIAITNGKLSFSPAETEKTIELTILADNFNEQDEDFTLELVNPRNATLATSSARIIIEDDDAEEDDPFGIPNEGYESPTSYPGMSLTWEENFSGTSLNTDDWTFEIGTGSNGWGNQELQYYQEDNTELYEGTLIIEAREENVGNSNYTSSRLVTLGKQQFKYGRIDIRASLPQGQGLWPAIWMLGSNIQQIGWPACGEIDIMELIGQDPRRVHGTAHYGASNAQHQYQGNDTTLPVGETFGDEFHVFSIIWEENSVKWILDDGEPFFELTPSDIGNNNWPFNNPQFFILNVAVGGQWPGSPNNTTIFPQRMFVDYIRVFQ